MTKEIWLDQAKNLKVIYFILNLVITLLLLLKYKKNWLWNRRLRHVNFDNMVKIRKLKRVRAIPSLKKRDAGLCKNCQIGKMEKTSFKSKNYQSKEVSEIVHTNLCEPIGIEIYSGEMFFILFV